LKVVVKRRLSRIVRLTWICQCRGEPTGKNIQIGNGIDAYIATPSEAQSKNAGILFLTDVIGIWQNSKLLADLFAARGYTTIVPDLFNGDPIPLNRPADFDLGAWRSQGSNGKNPHTPEAVDPLTIAGIKALKDMGIKRIGAVGYCFGAKVGICYSKLYRPLCLVLT
jgi:dienelactone hydrolase